MPGPRECEIVASITNINIQSAYAKATADKTADKLAIGNIGTGNTSTMATFYPGDSSAH